MKQKQFEQQHQQQWQQLADALDQLERPGGYKKIAPHVLQSLPEQYRAVAHQQALARERGYGLDLVQQLNHLTLRTHRQLFRTSAPLASRISEFIITDFPRCFRQQIRWFLFSLLLFTLSIGSMLVAVTQSPELAWSVMDPQTLENMESMYDPSGEHHGTQRDSGGDIHMFGFYIMNNIGIGFRTWASGLFFGIGSLFVIIFNGFFFGTVAGHLINIGYQTPFFSFVIAHGAPELSAIVIAGGAGMKLGWSLLAPGQLTRKQALIEAVRQTLPLIYGIFLLLLVAAFIEAFWSSRPAPVEIKYTIGSACWLLLYFYLFFAGRVRNEN